MEVRLAGKRRHGDRVVELELHPVDGDQLPAWQPGAHIDLHLPGGLVRQYSLCDAEPDASAWRVCVSLDPRSRGGSAAVHHALSVGDVLEVSEPRNNFPFTPAPHQVFLAGGIGITPLRAMIGAVADSPGTWSLHYGVASASEAIHREWLDRLGDSVVLHDAQVEGFPDFKAILASHPETVRVYACGPAAMLDAVAEAARDCGVTDLHTELFSVETVDTHGDSFEVHLHQSDLTFTVGPDETIMQVAEDRGFEFPRSCEDGICGSCITDVISGEPDHRDHVLTDEERAAGDLVLPCVSRARGRLVLDC